MTLSAFRAALTATSLADLRAGLIGERIPIPGVNGPVPLIYADYVASGRALRQVEDYIAAEVLPFYANSHTEASYCGAYMTRLRQEARQEIARLTGADQGHAVVFSGSGATCGINRLVSLLGVETAMDPVVFVGPYEHHSNILPWRESRARVIEIPEAAAGGPDLTVLEHHLHDTQGSDLRIGSFSAASNVTGIVTETGPVTRLLKAHGALSLWDYAGGGPYLPINMTEGGARKDAVVVSPHKFPGGPGASGLLIVDRGSVATHRPTWPGGGTVRFVSPWAEDYAESVEAREEAGTPNVIGDIRAACAFLVKEAAGQSVIHDREADLNARALARWTQNPHLSLLGTDRGDRLPIFSMQVQDGERRPVHQQLFTRMLSDIYGIQARGGCACAGPYAHRLLDIDHTQSAELRARITRGEEMQKPGWVRLNFSYLMDDDTADYIIDSVDTLARETHLWSERYIADPATARFKPDVQAA